MYSIIIKSGNEWMEADLPSTLSIAATFEEAGIAEMTLKGNGTQEIVLPLTARNKQIFGYADDPLVQTDIVRRRLECRVFADWMPIFKGGAYCVLLRVSAEGFAVSFVGGSADVFTTLKAIDFTEQRDVFGFVRKWSTNYTDAVDNDGTRHERGGNGLKGSELPLIPLVSLRTKLEQMTNFVLPEVVFREGYYISFVDRKRATELTDKVAFDKLMQGKGSYVSTSLRQPDKEHYVAESSFLPTKVSGYGLRVMVVLKQTNTPYSNVDFKFVLVYNGVSKTISYRLNGKPTDNGFVKGYAEVGGLAGEVYYKYINFWNDGTITDDNGKAQSGVGFSVSSPAENPTSIEWGYADYAITKTEIVQGVTYNTFSPSYPSGCYYCMMQPMIQHGNEYAEAYGEMYVADNLGFKTALDLYKALVQTFGYITHSESKVVSVYSLAEVQYRKRNALDWTDKVISTEDSFQPDGYCKVNHYAFKADTENGLQTERTILCDNDNLEASKTTEIGFLSGNKRVGFAWVIKEENGSWKWRKLAAPYLCEYSGSTYRFADATDMEGYDAVEQILKSWREIDAEMILTDKDISALTHSVPIYLEQYGAFFYVQKVSAWISGKSCKIHLIKI